MTKLWGFISDFFYGSFNNRNNKNNHTQYEQINQNEHNKYMFEKLSEQIRDFKYSVNFLNQNNNTLYLFEQMSEQIKECKSSISFLKWIVGILSSVVMALISVILILYLQ